MKLEDIKILINDISNKIDFTKSFHYYNNRKAVENFCSDNKEFNNYEVYFLIKNRYNLENLHIFCPVCGKKNRYSTNNSNYPNHCSGSCATSDPIVQKRKQNTYERIYGNKNYYKTDHYLKRKDEILTRRKNTLKNLYGDQNYHNIEKMKQTNLKRYGVEYNWASKDPKLNGKETLFKKYGVKHNWSSKDPKLNGRDTMLKRYGFKSTFLSKDSKLNGTATMMKKYGVKYYALTTEFKNKWTDKNFVKNRQNKIIATKKKNGTLNTSLIEDKLYIKLKNKYSDAIHHYSTDPRYHFECDFYIPSKDLFIELNFHWTHGSASFDENNFEHIEKLNLWKSKNTKFYKTAIDVWTKRDPLKLETFKKNNLNYKIFYTEKEFNDWLKVK